jgi:hypothetical protein
MAYIYADVDNLEGQPLVGYTSLCSAGSGIREGATGGTVEAGNTRENDQRHCQGDALATFVDGAYPNKSTGNHAALFISQDNAGITVMDQWKGDPNKPTISSRKIRFKGAKDGKLIAPLSNNGDAYYIIE